MNFSASYLMMLFILSNFFDITFSYAMEENQWMVCTPIVDPRISEESGYALYNEYDVEYGVESSNENGLAFNPFLQRENSSYRDRFKNGEEEDIKTREYVNALLDDIFKNNSDNNPSISDSSDFICHPIPDEILYGF